IRGQDAGIRRRRDDDLGRARIVRREEPGVEREQRGRLVEAVAWRIAGAGKRLTVEASKLALAVEGDVAADDDVADLGLGADRAGGASRDDPLRLAVVDQLAPHLRVGQLWPVLGHV